MYTKAGPSQPSVLSSQNEFVYRMQTLPSFARDPWVSIIQGETGGNPLWPHVCHVLQSSLYQLSSGHAIHIHLIPVSNFQLVLNSEGNERGCDLSPS